MPFPPAGVRLSKLEAIALFHAGGFASSLQNPSAMKEAGTPRVSSDTCIGRWFSPHRWIDLSYVSPPSLNAPWPNRSQTPKRLRTMSGATDAGAIR
jgi:hypothetical protein